MSRVHRWWSLVKSEVFKTRYHREELDLPQAPPKWVPHLPKAMFSSSGAKPTIAEEELQKILMQKPDWKLFTPATANVAVAAWVLLRWLSENDMWAKLPEVWRATIVPVGILLQCKATQAVSLALWSSDYAVLTWPMQRLVCNGLELFLPQSERSMPGWQFVYDLAMWEVVPHKVLPPSLVRSRLRAAVAPHGVVLARSARDEALLQHSVRKGLLGCTSGAMTKLLKSLGFAPKDIPKTTLEKMVAVIRSVFPRMTNAQIGEMLKTRVGLQSVSKRASSLTSYNMECTDGIIEASEQSDAKKDLFDQDAASLAQVQTLEFMLAKKLGSEVARMCAQTSDQWEWGMAASGNVVAFVRYVLSAWPKQGHFGAPSVSDV